MYVEYEKNSIQHMNASCRPPDDQLQDNGEGQTVLAKLQNCRLQLVPLQICSDIEELKSRTSKIHSMV